jgi:hypothetical protein
VAVSKYFGAVTPALAFILLIASFQVKANTDVICSYAPSKSAVVSRISAGVGGAGAGAAAILQSAGLTVVAHSSGAYIFTGTGGYVAGTMGVAVVAPVIIIASVLVGGSAIALELTCLPKNHPDAIKKVDQFTAEFHRAVLSANDKGIDVRDATVNKIRESNNSAIDARKFAINKINSVNNEAIEFRDKTKALFAKGWL